MRRFLIAGVVVGLLLNAGLSFAEDKNVPQMPEEVRKFLDNMTGTWNVEGVWEDDGKMEGKMEQVWDSRTNTLIGNAEFQWKDISGVESSMWHWDGISQDGIILSWSSLGSEGFSRGNIHGRVLSPTLMEAKQTNFIVGVKVTADVRVEVKGPNRFTWQRTNRIANGEKKPDETDVYVRAKGVTPEDFEEFCRLYEGRWACDITWDADWTGFGKKGETVTAYMHNTISEDGNALTSKFYGGKGSYTELIVYGIDTRQIKSTWATSAGGMGHANIYKSRGKWIVEVLEFEADGTRAEYTITGTYSENGKKYTKKARGTFGNEELDAPGDVWHRLNK